jgi:hypothetical protein
MEWQLVVSFLLPTSEFSVHLNFITCTKNGFIRENLTPNQHSNLLRQYRAQRKEVQRQGVSIVEIRRPDRATKNAGDSVAKYQE